MDGRPLPGSAARGRRASKLAGRGGLALCAAMALALLLLGPAAFASAAPGTVVWSHTWNAGKPGTVSDVHAVRGPSGGLYVAATFRRGNGSIDVVLLRYAASGKRLWTRWFDGADHRADRVSGIAAASDGSLLVCGSTGVSGGGEDWLVLKYAGDGTRRWARQLGGAAARNDTAAGVAVDAKGNVVVTGAVNRRKTGTDWCTVKYAPDGFRKWVSTLSTIGVGDDHPNALALTADGRIVLAGVFASATRGVDAGLALYSASGHLTWRKVWQGLGPASDTLVAVAVNATGVAAVGDTHGALGAGDGLALRYTLGGKFLWNLVIDGGAEPSAPDSFRSVALETSGATVVGGSVTSASATGADAVVARFAESDGTQTGWWQWDAGADDGVVDVALAGDHVFAAGRLGASATPDALLAGLGPDLGALWTPPVLAKGTQGRTVIVVGGNACVAGLAGRDLLVAKVQG